MSATLFSSRIGAFSFRPHGRPPLSVREYRSWARPTRGASSAVGPSGDGDGEPPTRPSRRTLHRALPERRRAVVGELLPGCRLGDALPGAPVVPDGSARGAAFGRRLDRGPGGGHGVGDEGGLRTSRGYPAQASHGGCGVRDLLA